MSAPSKSYRLRKHADYQLVYKRGRKQHAKNIAYFYAVRPADRRSDTEGARVGLTVPKALGKAVDRNRIKRRLREAVRRNLELLSASLSTPIDIVLHPRRTVMEMEFAALEREVGVIFRAVQKASELAERRVGKITNELPRGTQA
ncbi:MAG: ribonuclease P protein component [Acidobacteriota bacterium]|nr:ribonuclease P protein component [Acidobacteriota bacterium]